MLEQIKQDKKQMCRKKVSTFTLDNESVEYLNELSTALNKSKTTILELMIKQVKKEFDESQSNVSK